MFELINGDCIVEMENLINQGIKVDLVLTDLPYGTTNCKWDNIIPFDKMWNCIHNLSLNNTPILLFGNEPFSSSLRMSNISEYKYDWVWDKSIRTGHLNANKRPLRQTEDIMVFYGEQPYYNPIMWKGKDMNHSHKTNSKKNNNVYKEHKEVPVKLTKMKYPTNLLSFNARKGECNNLNRAHPTQKPVSLLMYLIKTYTRPNDIVLDFTMGSGSTGVACLQTRRGFIGIELDENYFNIAKKRCNEYQSKLI